MFGIERKLTEKDHTHTWNLVEIGKNFFRMHNIYEEGIQNYNMFKGKQWEGLIRPSGGAEPIVLNFIKV